MNASQLNTALGSNIEWVKYVVTTYKNPKRTNETLHDVTLMVSGVELVVVRGFRTETAGRNQAAEIATPWLRENGWLRE